MVHVREVAVYAVAALLTTILGAAFAQVAIVLVVVAPVLSQHLSTPRLIVAIVVPTVLAIACGWAARAAWRSIPRQASQASPVHDGWPDPGPAS